MQKQRIRIDINPFAIVLLICLAIEAYLLLKLSGKVPAKDGIFAMGSSLSEVSPISVGLYLAIMLPFIRILYILSRNYSVIQQMKAGKYWLRWDYSDEDCKRYAKYLPRGAKQVYIGPKGVFYPNRRFFLNGYHDGLFEVSMSVTPIDALCFMNTRTFKEPQVYSTSGRPVRMRNLKNVAATIQYDVPIPAGCEAEARQLSEEWTKRPIHYGFALSNSLTSGLLWLSIPAIMFLSVFARS